MRLPAPPLPTSMLGLAPGTHRHFPTKTRTEGITPEAALVPNRFRTKAAGNSATSTL